MGWNRQRAFRISIVFVFTRCFSVTRIPSLFHAVEQSETVFKLLEVYPPNLQKSREMQDFFTGFQFGKRCGYWYRHFDPGLPFLRRLQLGKECLPRMTRRRKEQQPCQQKTTKR